MTTTTTTIAATGEHEFEAAPGLPQRLPPGERLLWQGAPSWTLLARDCFHWRALALYFALLLAWRGAEMAADGAGSNEIVRAVAGGIPLALLAFSLLLLMAWLVAHTAVYTITDQRIVMRIGIVLSVSFNLPLSQIASAELRAARDGSGDIALTLVRGQRIAYLHLWPHARPWRFKHTQPMLRGLPDVRRVGALLASVAKVPAA